MNSRRRLTELLLRNATVIIFLAVFLYFGLQAPRFLGLDSVANIVKQASFIGVIAVGMTFVLLTAGIDLSVGSNMYLSAMAAGYLLQNPGAPEQPGASSPRSSSASAPGVVFGAVNAFCIVVLRITPFLVTLATLVAGRGLGTAITESFGIEFPRLPRLRRLEPVLGIPMPIVVFAHRGRCRPHRPEPHAVRPADLCGRQRPRSGAQGRHRRRSHRLLGLRHLRLLRRGRRRDADRADRPAQPDVRRRQGVRRDHRRGAGRHQPVRRRRLRRSARWSARRWSRWCSRAWSSSASTSTSSRWCWPRSSSLRSSSTASARGACSG